MPGNGPQFHFDFDGTFNSREEAHDLNDLVRLCDKYWDESREYLYDGGIEKWLRKKGITDLANKITGLKRQARDVARDLPALNSQEEERNIGLENFLLATNLVSPPGFTLTHNRLEIRVSSPKDAWAKFNIAVQGRGHLYGSIRQTGRTPPPLLIKPTEFSANRAREPYSVEIEVTVRNFDSLTPNRQYTATIAINTNVGSRDIPIIVERVAWVEPVTGEDDEWQPPPPKPEASAKPSLFILFLKLINIAAAVYVYRNYSLSLAIYAFLFITAPLRGIWEWRNSWDRSIGRFISALIFPFTFATFYFGSNFLYGQLWLGFLLGVVVGGVVALQLRMLIYPDLFDEWWESLSSRFRALEGR